MYFELRASQVPLPGPISSLAVSVFWALFPGKPPSLPFSPFCRLSAYLLFSGQCKARHRNSSHPGCIYHALTPDWPFPTLEVTSESEAFQFFLCACSIHAIPPHPPPPSDLSLDQCHFFLSHSASTTKQDKRLDARQRSRA